VEQDLDEDQVLPALRKLTRQEVDEYYVHEMIVPNAVLDLLDANKRALFTADPRNDSRSYDSGFIMLNTYSSFCMYPVIRKMLASAKKEIDKATKVVKDGASSSSSSSSTAVPNAVAAGAFAKAAAAVLAVDSVDHWRCDTESPEDCRDVAKRAADVLKGLLWFRDEELGLVDPPGYSRRALLASVRDMDAEWGDCPGFDDGDDEEGGDGVGIVKKCLTPQNGRGMGRPLAASTGDKKPAAKKAKTAPAAAGAAANGGNDAVLAYLDALRDDDKLAKRVKTQLRLKITSASGQAASVVVTGAADVKKINQVCAFVTGHDQLFEFHSQKGKCLKGSRMEIRLTAPPPSSGAAASSSAGCVWLAEKAAAKSAAAAGAGHADHKSFKIVQIFQGLNTSKESGIVYDSDAARRVATTAGCLVWVAPSGQRYDVSVEAIVPNKCVGLSYPLPRVVKHAEGFNAKLETGYGKPLYAINRILAGDREGPSFFSVGPSSAAERRRFSAIGASRPLTANRDDPTELAVEKYMFLPDSVASAGLPQGVATSSS